MQETCKNGGSRRSPCLFLTRWFVTTALPFPPSRLVKVLRRAFFAAKHLALNRYPWPWELRETVDLALILQAKKVSSQRVILAKQFLNHMSELRFAKAPVTV